MSVITGRSIFLTEEEQQQAARSIERLGSEALPLRTETGKILPDHIGSVIEKVLQAIKHGVPITVSSLPEEVTTTAAAMLGISRPAWMKHVRAGRINSRKVGSHHKLLSRDVIKFREYLVEENAERFSTSWISTTTRAGFRQPYDRTAGVLRTS